MHILPLLFLFQPADVNAVDLDTATVTLCEEKRSKLTTKLLPKKAARQLRARLASLLEKVRHHRKQARKLEATQDDGAIDFEFKMKRAEMQLDLEIREVFLHFMVSVLVRSMVIINPISKRWREITADCGITQLMAKLFFISPTI